MSKLNYSPSLLESDGCYFCNRTDGKIDRHEVFHGPNRAKSAELGCWVNLCHNCHMQLHQTRPEMDKELKQICQVEAMKHYGWTVNDFRNVFGKNFI